MRELGGTQTEKNLLAAFLSESADQNRYFYFAKVAKKAGYVSLSRVFEETALQERSHAKSFFKHLSEGELTLSASFSKGRIGTTMENLAQAAAIETRQQDDIYPSYARTAAAEGFPKIAALFSAVATAERFHAARFRSFIEAIENDTLFRSDTAETWVCTKCGYIHEGPLALEKCPACGHGRGYFERTDIL